MPLTLFETTESTAFFNETQSPCRTRVSDPHHPCDTLAFSMATADLPKREAPDSLMLTGFWYRALPSEKVKPGSLHKAVLLEIPLVLGRDRNAKPFALRDACPHRGMPLSCGRFDGGQVECN